MSHVPTVGSLLRAELLRIRSRRFARWSVVGLLALMAVIAVLQFRDTAAPSAEDLAAARQQCSQQYTFDQGSLEGEGVEVAPDTFRSVAVVPECDTVDELVDAGAFEATGASLPAHPGELPDWIVAVGIGVAVLAFLFGCTLGGADWSNRTMPALLFWEPRRLRLFTVKASALALAVVALFVVVTLVWLAVSAFLISVHGVWDDGSTGLAGDLANAVACSLVLVVAAAWLGFGLANLTRNTGAALGVAFVYFVIAEQAIGFFLSWATRWLFNVNFGALLTPGGLTFEKVNGDMVHISQAAGGALVLTYVVVVLAVAALLFRRRDIT